MKNINVRIAGKEDAEDLFLLNKEFNGSGSASAEFIGKALEENRYEIVSLVEYDNVIAGFCCTHILKSMCYEHNHAEITELYIKAEYRKRGLATYLVRFCETYCRENCNVNKIVLLTGKNNVQAQKFYESIGFSDVDDEVIFAKYIRL